jgi:hypothetical protein
VASIFGDARRQGQVLRVWRVHDILRRERFGRELGRVDVDPDLPVLAAVWQARNLRRNERLQAVNLARVERFEVAKIN